jgi:hypothetical protein
VSMAVSRCPACRPASSFGNWRYASGPTCQKGKVQTGGALSRRRVRPHLKARPDRQRHDRERASIPYAIHRTPPPFIRHTTSPRGQPRRQARLPAAAP